METKDFNSLATINGKKCKIKRVASENISSGLPVGSRLLLPSNEIFCEVETENGFGYPILTRVLKVGKIAPKNAKYALIWRSQFAPINDNGEPLTDFAKFGESPIERNANLAGKVLTITQSKKYQNSSDDKKRTALEFDASEPTDEEKELLTDFDSIEIK